MVRRKGLEPPTFWFVALNMAFGNFWYRQIMACLCGFFGFEPLQFCVISDVYEG